MTTVFSVDVEDWFHILNVQGPDMSMWATLPSRVECNFMRMLDLMSESNARSTCFFLGWIAERYPHLVREAQKRGHEIASHGYAHRLVYLMSASDFRADALRAREVIEQTAGTPVLGYRAPGFSVTEKTPWFYDELLAAGYSYDASVFPAVRGHGGMKSARRAPHRITTAANQERSLIEFPQSVVEVLGKRLCFFGGGYLRLTPWPVIRAMGSRALRHSSPLIFYIHPRDIDPDQPRLPMSASRRFKTYVNLKSTESKLRSVLRHFPTTSFEAFLRDDGNTFLPNHAHAYAAAEKSEAF
jgi:polysaccharide deacetylase family protein (PEP-CTERM system associated)